MKAPKELLRKIGCGLATGALVLALVPLSACSSTTEGDDASEEGSSSSSDVEGADDANADGGTSTDESSSDGSASGDGSSSGDASADGDSADGSSSSDDGPASGSAGEGSAEGSSDGGTDGDSSGEGDSTDGDSSDLSTMGVPDGGSAPSGDMPSGDMGSGEAPDASGDSSDGNSDDSTDGSAPSGDMPSGDMGSGEAPDASGDSSDGGTDGSAPGGDIGSGTAPDASGGTDGGTQGGGANTMTFDYSGTYSGVLSADGESVTVTEGSYEATESDQNAALVQNGGSLFLSNASLSKSGDDTDGDRCNFYGVNSVFLAVGEGSTATLQSIGITASSEGSNGIFSTDGATVLATDFSISTSADNSRGLDATYGGTIVAGNATIETQGAHCAAIATDRGGGYISVVDSTLSTAGQGSPLLYSTGDVEVSGVSGTATGSQIAGMEGTNTILINDSTLTSTVTAATASDPVANGVIIYQSTSGDAEASTGDTATFQVANSTLTSSIESGAMFYVTNTQADIVLSSTTLDFDSTAADLLLVAGNDANNWGSAGSNGGTVNFTAIAQTLEGTVEVDTISSAVVYLTDGSTWTGKTLISENANGSSSEAPLSVAIDDTSTWVVTEDCTLSALTVASGGSVVDADGNAVTIVAGGQTVVTGSSDITVTVTGSYSTDYDSSAAGTLATDLIDRSDYDSAFSTSTAWTMGDSTATTGESASDGTSGLDELIAFFQPLIDAFLEAYEEATGESLSGSDTGSDSSSGSSDAFSAFSSLPEDAA